MQKICSVTYYFTDESWENFQLLYMLPQFSDCKSESSLTLAVLKDYRRMANDYENIKNMTKITQTEIFKLKKYHSCTIRLMKIIRSSIDDWISDENII